MRRFTDDDSRRWDVLVGRESWGHFVVLFVPRDPDLEPRQAPLEVEGHGAATRALNRMEEEELAGLFRRSTRREPGGEGG